MAQSKEKLEAYPTKRKVSAGSTVVSVRLDPNLAKTEHITIDQIESFSEVRNISASSYLQNDMSETEFKAGIQGIIKEHGEFKDWGGEKNDLYTTHMKLSNQRMSTAFAFKGPGTKGILTPKKMGKNGDQIQRLFSTDAEVFIVQYHSQIDESVIDQMYQLAVAKSAMTGRKIYYGVIDGADSKRIVDAYQEQFPHDNSSTASDE